MKNLLTIFFCSMTLLTMASEVNLTAKVESGMFTTTPLPPGVGQSLNWLSITDGFLRMGTVRAADFASDTVVYMQGSDSILVGMGLTTFRILLNSGYLKIVDTASMLSGYQRSGTSSSPFQGTSNITSVTPNANFSITGTASFAGITATGDIETSNLSSVGTMLLQGGSSVAGIDLRNGTFLKMTNSFGTTIGFIDYSSGIRLSSTSGQVIVLDSLLPGSNNFYTLGNASFRWKNVYATSGDISGTLTASTLAGTISTAIQPNITSVGTISNLTVSGYVNANVFSASNSSVSKFGNILAVADINAYNLYATGLVGFPSTPTANNSVSILGLDPVGGYAATTDLTWDYNSGSPRLNASSIAVSGNQTIGGTLTVTGRELVGSLSTTGNISSGGLTTTGGITIGSNSTVNGILTVTGQIRGNAIGLGPLGYTLSGNTAAPGTYMVSLVGTDLTFSNKGQILSFLDLSGGPFLPLAGGTLIGVGQLNLTGLGATGSVTATTLGGLLTTASQTGITLLGNQSGFTVVGSATITGGTANFDNTVINASGTAKTGLIINANSGSSQIALKVNSGPFFVDGNGDEFGRNITVSGVISTSGFTTTSNATIGGNLITTGVISAAGLTTSGNVDANTLSVSGTATFRNIGLSPGSLGGLSINNTASSNNSLQWGYANIATGFLDASGRIRATGISLTGNEDIGTNLTVGGSLTAGIISASGLTTSGSISIGADANITANVIAVNLSASGNVYGTWAGIAISNAKLANSTISGISLGNNLNNLSATDATLTFSGSYNGSTARTIGLNLGNTNTWSAAQIFPSTTKLEGAGAPTFVLNSTSTGVGTGPYITIKRNGSDIGYLGSDAALNSTNTNDISVMAISQVNIHAGAGYPKILQIANTGISVTGTLGLTGYTVAGLPTAGTIGRVVYVTDGLTPSFGVIIVGGGSTKIPVFDNGTNWVAF